MPDSIDVFSQWVQFAELRRQVMLMDGRIAELRHVRKAPRSCKVKLYNRHYNCWIEDIALVMLPTGPSLALSWCYVEAWPAVDLSTRPGIQPRRLRAAPSKHWLEVKPNPGALHPSFGASRASLSK
jgi:hypothetical protein